MADETTPTPATTEVTPTGTKANHLLETPADGPDPDEAEYQAALKEVEAENAANPETPAAEVVVQPETPAAPVVPEHGGQTVPLAVAQEERQKRQELEEELRRRTATTLFWQGVAEGRFPRPGVVGTPAVERTQTQNREQAIKSEMLDLAKEVDAGRISVEQQETERQKLDEELHRLRQAETLDAVKKAIPPSTSDLYLQKETAELETNNPWVDRIPADEINLLIPFARKRLAAEGINMSEINGTPLGDLRLREAIVLQAQEMGFDKKYGGTTPAVPKAPAVDATPTAAQRQEKIDLANRAPPQPQGSGAPANTWTEERVAAMDPLDLENMSKAELIKIGEIIDRQASATRVATNRR